MSDTCETCGIGVDLHGAVCGGTDQPSPPDAGPCTTVQGGGAGGVPAGWKLAPGWYVRHPEDYAECTWGTTLRQRGCQLRHVFQGDTGMACQVHAGCMGALVRDVTPCPECGHVPPHSLACSRSDASRAMRAGHDETCATRAGTSRNCDCARTTFDKVLASAEEVLGHVGETKSRPLMHEGPRSYEAITPEPASRQGEPSLSQRIREGGRAAADGDRIVGWDWLASQVAGLEAKLAVTESEANGWGAVADEYERKLDAAERERDEVRRENVRLGAQVDAWLISSDEATAKLAGWQGFHDGERSRWEGVLTRTKEAAENRVANAIRDERDRCLALVETYEPKREVPNEWSREGALARIADEIRNGKPAPRGTTE